MDKHWSKIVPSKAELGNAGSSADKHATQHQMLDEFDLHFHDEVRRSQSVLERTTTNAMVAIHTQPLLMTSKPVPKDWRTNSAYRRAILNRAEGDIGFQSEILARCREDPIWSCNAFAWTYSPKDYEDCPDRPFILYDFQEDALPN